MFLKSKRTGGDLSGPAAEVAHEKRGRAPAGPLRYRCAIFGKRDPALLSNRATLGVTIMQETNFALWTPDFTVFATGQSLPPCVRWCGSGQHSAAAPGTRDPR
jgi:hypothetical protein